MKLPGADYSRGMSSLGREDVSAPTAVSRAEFAAASAKGQLASAMGHTAGIIEAWAFAEDQLKASQASSEYAQTMAKTVDLLKTSPTIKSINLPPGALKEGDEREEVPTWEVAPAFYDAVEKEAYAKASKAPQNRRVRSELEGQLGTQRSRNGAAVSSFYMTAKRKDMEGKFEESVKLAVQAGAPDLAISHIDKAVAAGVYDYKEGVVKKEKVLHDVEDLKVARAIAESSDPAQLEKVSNAVLMNDQSRLTPDERRAYANQAQTKADRIQTKTDKAQDEARKERSSRLLGSYTYAIRIENKLPSRAELQAMAMQMEPSDYRQLLVLYDRKDKNDTGNPAAEKGLGRMVTGLMDTVPGMPLDVRAENAKVTADKAYNNGEISHKVWRQTHADIEDTVRRGTTDDPNLKMARDTLFASIAKAPRGTILQPGGDNLRFVVAQEAENALIRAKLSDPKLDPAKWVAENMPAYMAKSNDVSLQKARSMFGGESIKMSAKGELDIQATTEYLRQQAETAKTPAAKLKYKRWVDQFGSTQ